MEKPADIENTGNRVRTKPGETRPNWPRNWRRKNSFKTSIAVILYGFEYAAGWYYYLYGNIASFRFLLQLSAVMLFAFGVYGVTMDMEKRPIDRGVREATLFAMIARAYALPEGKGARALKSGVEALARDGVAMKEIDLSGAGPPWSHSGWRGLEAGQSAERDPYRGGPQRRRSIRCESERRGLPRAQISRRRICASRTSPIPTSWARFFTGQIWSEPI